MYDQTVMVSSMKNRGGSTWSSELVGRIVHVWSIPTEASSAVIAELWPILASDEQERARRFHFKHLQRSFVLARGALRLLLGCYLNASPASVQFRYSSKGKPSLGEPARLKFNASHSVGLAMFAFTLDCDLGVDIEHFRPMQERQNIANLFFCSEEATELMALPPEQRDRAFFLCWTRKEAYIKAIGEGLSMPLDGFQVTLQPDEPARFVHLAHDFKAAKAWTLHDLKLDASYIAALAYRDTQRPVDVLSLAEPAELLSFL
jgi:4'-phosphopantetheinyl transferase